MRIARIPSRLYYELFTAGGDRLIAVYLHIKYSREKGEVKLLASKSANHKNLGGYSLLRSRTGMSLATLKKYVPKLIELGLISISPNGDIIIAGNQRLKDSYNHKLVPICLGKNMIETATYAIAVRVHQKYTSQLRIISKKQDLSEKVKLYRDPSNLREYNTARNIRKKYGETIEIVDKPVLSIQGWGAIKDGSDTGSLGKGMYWKKKFRAKGIISTRRRFKKLEKTTHKMYSIQKELNLLSPHNTYILGYISRELVSSFSFTLEVYSFSC